MLKSKFGILNFKRSKQHEFGSSVPWVNFFISGKKFYKTASINFSFIAILTPSQMNSPKSENTIKGKYFI